MGNDTLTGGEGVDAFVFASQLDAATNVDRITDFVSGSDRIQLLKTRFSGFDFSGITTSDSFFHLGVTAQDADDRILYDAATGDIYYDADGSGEQTAIRFAVLDGLPTLSYQDFEILATGPRPDRPLDNASATEDLAFSLQVPANIFADPGVPLAYAAQRGDGSALPAWLHFDAASLTFSGTPVNEDVGVLTVRLTATDQDGLSGGANFTVTVLNTNDAPTLEQPIADQNAMETVAFDFLIQAGTFAEVDAGDRLTYSFTAIPGEGMVHPAWLSLDPATGRFTGTPSDAETGTLTIQVTATDTVGATASEEFVLTIQDFNQAPTRIDLAGNHVDENAANGTIIGTLSTTDPDAADTTHSYRLVDDAGGRFTLSGDQLLVADGGLLDYEQHGSHTLQVESTDMGGMRVTQSLLISLNNINEAPSSLHLTHAEVAENSLGGVEVGSLLASDPEPGDSHTYQLLDDAGGRFVLDGNQIQVALGATLDYETQSSHTIRVRATDGGGLSLEQDMVIRLTNQDVDLQVAAVTLPAGLSSIQAGASFELSWSIATQGNEPSVSSWVDRIYLDDPNTPGLDRHLGDYSITTALPLGVPVQRIQTLHLPEDVSGNYRVIVITDALNQIVETGAEAESNNERASGNTLAVHPIPTANLVLDSVTAPASAFTGRGIEVQWVVRNTGEAPTSSPYWYDQIWLSSDGILNGGDTLLATVQNPGYLDIGQSYRNSAALTLPTGIEGNYRILVQTDSHQYIPENGREADNIAAGGALAVLPIPLSELSDPAVVSVSAPAQVFSGQRIDISYRIENAGQAAISTGAPAWLENIYLSTDTQLDGGDTLLSSTWRYLSPAQLPQPNGASSFSVTESVVLPMYFSGDYHFLVQISPNAANSNVFTSNDLGFDAEPTQVRLTPPPDLDITAVTVPASAQTGHAFIFSYSVENSSATATPSDGWHDRFYLSSDTTFDPQSDIPLASVWHAGALNGSDSYGGTVEATLPVGIEGSYYVIGVTDAAGALFETDENNNIKISAPVDIVLRQPDLVVTAVSVPQTALAGKSLLVNWSVNNQGEGDTLVSSWKDLVILSTDTILGNSDDRILGAYNHIGVLGPNETYLRSAAVALPHNLSGEFHVYVAADGYDAVDEGSNETNNAREAGTSITSDGNSGGGSGGGTGGGTGGNTGGNTGTPIEIIVRQPADLQITTVDIPATVASGQPFSLSYGVTNTGSGKTETAYWFDQVILSSDAILGNADDQILAYVHHYGVLDPQQSYQGTATITLPIDLQGNFQVFIRADAGNAVAEAEAGESNNVSPSANLAVTLSPTADLAITTLAASAQAVSGQNLDLTWTVTNQGGGDATGGWYQSFYLSRDQILDKTSDIYLGYERGSALNAGATEDFQLAARIPNGVAGQYYLFAVADSGDSVYERGAEGNNTTFAATPVQIALPSTALDLLNSHITLPADGVPGQTISISYSASNQGANTITGGWQDALYLSRDTTWDIDDPLFARLNLSGPLEAGASFSQTATAQLPGLALGDYHVILRGDIRNQIPETSETNNLQVSLDIIHIDVESLIPGTADSGVLAQGESVYYRIDAAAGETLKVMFDRAVSEGRTELYIRHGEMPSRSDYDHAYKLADSPDQAIVIPSTRAGTYYVMAYNAAGDAGDYSIQADTLHFSIDELSQHQGSNQGQVTVRINGAEFTTHTAARLIGADGVEHSASQVLWKDGNELWATFDLRGLAIGAYDLRLADGDQSAHLDDAFTVTHGALGHVEYGMETPPALRPGQSGTVRVYYQNTGETDALAPLLTVSGNALLKLQGEAEFAGTSLQLLGINSEGPAGILPPGAQGSFQLVIQPAFSGGGTINLAISTPQPDQALDWDTLLETSRPDGIDPASWAQIKVNLIEQFGSTTGEYQARLAETATYLDQLEGRTADISQLFRLDFLRASAGGALLRGEEPSAMGIGRDFAWDIRATRLENGDVLVTLPGAQLLFAKQADGSYQGDSDSTLRETGGAFELLQPSGSHIAFNLDGSLASLQNSYGHRVRASYSEGRLAGIGADNGDSLAFSYNAAGRLIQQTDQDGRVVSFGYDADNLYLTSITTPLGTTQYAYVSEPGAARGQLSSITYTDGAVRHFEYDVQGRLSREYANDGAESISYSHVGVNEVIVNDASGDSIHLWLNQFGQIAQTEDALGRISQMRYDADGNLIGIVNADGGTGSISYDAAGNPLTAQDALGHTVAFSYEAVHGQLTSVTDQRGNPIAYGYDAYGNLNSITYADGSRETYSYDADGLLNIAVNRRGETINYQFDDQGQLTGKTYADGSSASFAYDARGNLTRATDADSDTTFAYDASDRLTRVDDGDGRWVAYEYDAVGRRSQISDQAGHVSNYSYDALGHLARVSDSGDNTIASYSYDASGRLSRGDNGNGTYTTYEYDAAGQLTHLVNHQADGTVSSRFDYSYDAAGHRTEVTTLDGATHYDYDPIGQLTGVTLPDGRHIESRYDAAGNRISVEDNGALTNYVANDLNQYTDVGDTAYHYDADGNLTSKTESGITTTYGYDAENRLVSVTTPTDTWAYEYDALGNRIASIHNDERTEYLLDPTGLVNVVGEYDGSGNLLAHYSHGLGLESMANPTAGSLYYDFDALGSTAGLSNAGGIYLNQYAYLPFGENVLTTEGVANAFEYVGQWGVMAEGNGLDYMRARFYSEGDGRFVQPDPIGFAGGINIYAYTTNSPVNYYDPSGMVKEGQVILGSISIVTSSVGYYVAVGAGTALATAGSPLLAAAAVTGILTITVYKTVGGIVSVITGLQDKESPISGAIFTDILGTQFGTVGKSAGGLIDIGIDLAIGSKVDSLGVVLSKSQNTLEFIDKTSGAMDVWFDFFEEANKFPGTPIDNPSYGQGSLDNSIVVPVIPPAYDPHDMNVNPTYGQGSLVQYGMIPVIAPRDPNDILGPQGYGEEHWVSSQNPLAYTIRYENQASATAPAQQVSITQKLDDDLNLASFRLGDFGWGDLVIDVPEGVSIYTTRIDLRDSQGYLVDVIAGVDVERHEAFWTFTTIDPATGEIPENPTIGFLPTNVVKGDGEGFVNYSIRLKSDAPTGTVIDAAATIVFSTQEPIDTPAIFNTLDRTLPESRTEGSATGPSDQPVPVNVSSTQFLVRWSGTDSGAALADYSIHVSDNGGAYIPWLTNTTETEALFEGQAGHSYAFYSVARDHAGNRETIPAQADLLVSVAADASLNDLSAPTILALTPAADGIYGIGQALEFSLHFSETVFVETGITPPALALTIGASNELASYVSGSGSDTLVFRHLVQSGAHDNDGIALGASLLLQGGNLRDAAGNPLSALDFTAQATPGIRINNLPTGTVAISGIPHLGETLTASNTLDDLDGLGAIAYQWKADSVDILGATGGSLTLTAAEAGKTIRVLARYNDGHGTPESVASAATAPVVSTHHGTHDNNHLTALTTHDTLIGGSGDDTYTVLARSNIVNEGPSEGSDTVRAPLSWTLGANLENLELLGTHRFSANGNSLDNSLTGNDAGNLLNGGRGADTLNGGAGNDTYVVDRASDVIQETGADTGDSVRSWVDWTLGDNLENLTLLGFKPLDGSGNSLNNRLTGNGRANALDGDDGNDTLNGASGNDTLTGGAGSDTFAFTTPLNAVRNVDTLTDFVSGTDKIELSSAIFREMGFSGSPSSDVFFHAGNAAQDADDRILYDQGNGALSYDADGSGALAAVRFAVLSGAPAMLYSDLLVA